MAMIPKMIRIFVTRASLAEFACCSRLYKPLQISILLSPLFSVDDFKFFHIDYWHTAQGALVLPIVIVMGQHGHNRRSAWKAITDQRGYECLLLKVLHNKDQTLIDSWGGITVQIMTHITSYGQ